MGYAAAGMDVLVVVGRLREEQICLCFISCLDVLAVCLYSFSSCITLIGPIINSIIDYLIGNWRIRHNDNSTRKKFDTKIIMKGANPTFIIIQSQGCEWILQYNCC